MGPINSDRQKVQLLIESEIGCRGAEHLKDFSLAFESYKISHQKIGIFRKAAEQDVVNLFERANLSLALGIGDSLNGNDAWAVVKLYYAVYYFLRAELALNGYSIIRCKSLHYLKVATGETPKKWRKENTDHKATIGMFKQFLSEGDVLSSNSIDGEYAYEWLSSMREWANYRLSNFPEFTLRDLFFDRSHTDINDQVEYAVEDSTPYLCFDKDYACLALPIKRAQISSRNFLANGLSPSSNYLKHIDAKFRELKLSSKLDFIRLKAAS